MRPTTTLLASLIAASAFALGLTLALPAAADTLAPVPPTPMPAFKLPGLNGSSGSDTDLRNKVTIIRFWASW
jgi:hypothetical protein